MKLRTFIFLTVFSLGLLPLLTLVVINLPDHLARHEQDAVRANLARARIQGTRLQAELDRLGQTLQHLGSLPVTRAVLARTATTEQQQELRRLSARWLAGEKSLAAAALWAPGAAPLLLLPQEESQRMTELELPEPAAAAVAAPGQGTGEPAVQATVTRNDDLLLLFQVTGERQETVGSAALLIDLERLLADLPGRFWLGTDGFLRGPAFRSGPQTGVSREVAARFPGLPARLVSGAPFLWPSKEGDLAWLPLRTAGVSSPPLWVGLPVSRVAAGWKSSLLLSIFWVLLLMTGIIFLTAHRLAANVERLKEDMLTGLERILQAAKGVRFHWKGPRELQTLAQELNGLADRYAITSEARHKAEVALRESEEKFRNLTGSAHDAILLMDNRGDIAYWNEAATKIFGYADREALGQPVHGLLHPRRIEADGEPDRFQGLQGGAALEKTLELVTRRKNGSEVPVELSLSAARIQDRWHAIWIARDISERKEAEEKARRQQQQLVQADKMISLGLLVSGVAHEINNPNSIAMLNGPMLHRAWESVRPILEEYYGQHGDFLVAGLDYSEMREQIPRLFAELEESSRRIKQIVMDLKDYARQDTSRHMEPVDLNEIAKAAVRLTYNKIRKSTRYFVTHYDPGLPLVQGNWHRLEQVLINLIHNGCEALDNPEAGLTLATGYDPGEQAVILRVQDEGVGIAQEVLGQIADPFFTTKRNAGGTGLGLSVSAGIVKEHNGRLEFQSEPGTGTTVVLVLPALP